MNKIYCANEEIPDSCLECGCHKFIAKLNGNYNYKCLLTGDISSLSFEDLKERCPMMSYSDMIKKLVKIAKKAKNEKY